MDLKYNKCFACNDHIDIAMDEYINENETFPELIKSNEEKCAYCNNKSEYEVK